MNVTEFLWLLEQQPDGEASFPNQDFLQEVGSGQQVIANVNIDKDVRPELDAYALIWTPEVIFRVATIVFAMVLTLIGNITLISVITCHASLRHKRVSVFLLNLAVGDLMVCFVTMTTEILFVAFGEWVLGAIACKIIVYGQMVTLSSTTFLLTAMSVDRYQVLVQPLRSLRGTPHFWRKILLSWTLALVFAIPQLFIFVQSEELRPSDGKVIQECKSAGYSAEWQRKVYFSFLTGYILVVPTAIMSFCYISIIRVVWIRSGGRDIDIPRIHFVTSRKSTGQQQMDSAPRNYSASRPAGKTGTGGADSKLLENGQPTTSRTRLGRSVDIPTDRRTVSSKRNVIKMTLSIIVGFVVCWTPYFVVSLIRIFSDYRILLTNAQSVSEIMALIHSALNPLLYMIFSKRALKAVCWKMRCVCIFRSRRRGGDGGGAFLREPPRPAQCSSLAQQRSNKNSDQTRRQVVAYDYKNRPNVLIRNDQPAANDGGSATPSSPYFCQRRVYDPNNLYCQDRRQQPIRSTSSVAMCHLIGMRTTGSIIGGDAPPPGESREKRSRCKCTSY